MTESPRIRNPSAILDSSTSNQGTVPQRSSFDVAFDLEIRVESDVKRWRTYKRMIKLRMNGKAILSSVYQ